MSDDSFLIDIKIKTTGHPEIMRAADALERLASAAKTLEDTVARSDRAYQAQIQRLKEYKEAHEAALKALQHAQERYNSTVVEMKEAFHESAGEDRLEDLEKAVDKAYKALEKAKQRAYTAGKAVEDQETRLVTIYDQRTAAMRRLEQAQASLRASREKLLAVEEKIEKTIVQDPLRKHGQSGFANVESLRQEADLYNQLITRLDKAAEREREYVRIKNQLSRAHADGTLSVDRYSRMLDELERQYADVITRQREMITGIPKGMLPDPLMKFDSKTHYADPEAVRREADSYNKLVDSLDRAYLRESEYLRIKKQLTDAHNAGASSIARYTRMMAELDRQYADVLARRKQDETGVPPGMLPDPLKKFDKVTAYVDPDVIRREADAYNRLVDSLDRVATRETEYLRLKKQITDAHAAGTHSAEKYTRMMAELDRQYSDVLARQRQLQTGVPFGMLPDPLRKFDNVNTYADPEAVRREADAYNRLVDSLDRVALREQEYLRIKRQINDAHLAGSQSIDRYQRMMAELDRQYADVVSKRKQDVTGVPAGMLPDPLRKFDGKTPYADPDAVRREADAYNKLRDSLDSAGKRAREFTAAQNLLKKGFAEGAHDLNQHKQLMSALAAQYSSAKSAASGLESIFSAWFKPLASLSFAVVVFERFQRAVRDIIGPLWSAYKAHTDFIESVNMITVGLGKNYEAVKKWSDALSSQLAIDTIRVQEETAKWFMMMRNVGFSNEISVRWAQSLQSLTQDIASLRNRTFQEIDQKLKSGFSGNIRPLRELGIDVSEESLKWQALALGIGRVNRELSAYERFRAVGAQLWQATAADRGDIIRTWEAPANQLRFMSEQAVILKREFGAMISDVMGLDKGLIAATEALRGMVEVVRDLQSVTKSVGTFFDAMSKPGSTYGADASLFEKAYKSLFLETSKIAMKVFAPGSSAIFEARAAMEPFLKAAEQRKKMFGEREYIKAAYPWAGDLPDYSEDMRDRLREASERAARIDEEIKLATQEIAVWGRDFPQRTKELYAEIERLMKEQYNVLQPFMKGEGLEDMKKRIQIQQIKANRALKELDEYLANERKKAEADARKALIPGVRMLEAQSAGLELKIKQASKFNETLSIGDELDEFTNRFAKAAEFAYGKNTAELERVFNRIEQLRERLRSKADALWESRNKQRKEAFEIDSRDFQMQLDNALSTFGSEVGLFKTKGYQLGEAFALSHVDGIKSTLASMADEIFGPLSDAEREMAKSFTDSLSRRIALYRKPTLPTDQEAPAKQMPWERFWDEVGTDSGERFWREFFDAYSNIFRKGDIRQLFDELMQLPAQMAAAEMASLTRDAIFGGKTNRLGVNFGKGLLGAGGTESFFERVSKNKLATGALAAGGAIYTLGVARDDRKMAAAGGVLAGAAAGATYGTTMTANIIGAIIGAIVGGLLAYFSSRGPEFQRYKFGLNMGRGYVGGIEDMDREREAWLASQINERFRSVVMTFREIILEFAGDIGNFPELTKILEGKSKDLNSLIESFFDKMIPDVVREHYRDQLVSLLKDSLGTGLSTEGLESFGARLQQELNLLAMGDYEQGIKRFQEYIHAIRGLLDLTNELSGSIDDQRTRATEGAIESWRRTTASTMSRLQTLMDALPKMMPEEQIKYAGESLEAARRQLDANLQLLRQIAQLREQIQDQADDIFSQLDMAGMGRDTNKLTAYAYGKFKSFRDAALSEDATLESVQRNTGLAMQWAQRLMAIADELEGLLPSFDELEKAFRTLKDDLVKPLSESLDKATRDSWGNFRYGMEEALKKIAELSDGLSELAPSDYVSRLGEILTTTRAQFDANLALAREIKGFIDQVSADVENLTKQWDVLDAGRSGSLTALRRGRVNDSLADLLAPSEGRSPQETMKIWREFIDSIGELYQSTSAALTELKNLGQELDDLSRRFGQGLDAVLDLSDVSRSWQNAMEESARKIAALRDEMSGMDGEEWTGKARELANALKEGLQANLEYARFLRDSMRQLDKDVSDAINGIMLDLISLRPVQEQRAYHQSKIDELSAAIRSGQLTPSEALEKWRELKDSVSAIAALEKAALAEQFAALKELEAVAKGLSVTFESDLAKAMRSPWESFTVGTDELMAKLASLRESFESLSSDERAEKMKELADEARAQLQANLELAKTISGYIVQIAKDADDYAKSFAELDAQRAGRGTAYQRQRMSGAADRLRGSNDPAVLIEAWNDYTSALQAVYKATSDAISIFMELETSVSQLATEFSRSLEDLIDDDAMRSWERATADNARQIAKLRSELNSLTGPDLAPKARELAEAIRKGLSDNLAYAKFLANAMRQVSDEARRMLMGWEEIEARQAGVAPEGELYIDRIRKAYEALMGGGLSPEEALREWQALLDAASKLGGMWDKVFLSQDGKLMEVFEWLRPLLSTAEGIMKELFGDEWEKVKGEQGTLGSELERLSKLIGEQRNLLEEELELLRDALSSLKDELGEKFRLIVESIKEKSKEIADAIGEFAKDFAGLVKEKISEYLSALLNDTAAFLKELLGAEWEKVKEEHEKLIDELSKLVGDLGDQRINLTDELEELRKKLEEGSRGINLAFDSIYEQIQEANKKLLEALGSLADGITSERDALKSEIERLRQLVRDEIGGLLDGVKEKLAAWEEEIVNINDQLLEVIERFLEALRSLTDSIVGGTPRPGLPGEPPPPPELPGPDESSFGGTIAAANSMLSSVISDVTTNTARLTESLEPLISALKQLEGGALYITIDVPETANATVAGDENRIIRIVRRGGSAYGMRTGV